MLVLNVVLPFSAASVILIPMLLTLSGSMIVKQSFSKGDGNFCAFVCKPERNEILPRSFHAVVFHVRLRVAAQVKRRLRERRALSWRSRLSP